MGLNLQLLPFDCDVPDLAYSHTVLSCDRDYDLFDAIQAVETRRGRVVPPHFSTYLSRDDRYEEAHYGDTQETPYGEPLKEVEVEDLLALADLAKPRNLAVWAYLAALRPRTKIALFWH